LKSLFPKKVIVLTFPQVQSYFHREILTVCFALGALWPAANGLSFVRNHVFLTATWALGCCLMSTFTLLPVVKVEDITTMWVSSLTGVSG
jgi:phosphatidylinositol glycan class N